MLDWTPEERSDAPKISADFESKWFDSLVDGGHLVGITFGGQGARWWPTLKSLARQPRSRRLIALAQQVLEEQLSEDCAVYREGVDLSDWLRNPSAAPSNAYLARSAISQPLILLTQLLAYQRACVRGLSAAFEQRLVAAASGHSQGLLAALLIAESAGGELDDPRVVDYLRYAARQGRVMDRYGRSLEQATWPAGTSPMMAIEGLRADELRRLLRSEAFDADVELALVNGLESCVVSGDPSRLRALARRLETLAQRESGAGSPRFVGDAPFRPVGVETTFLSVSAPFHSSAMRDAERRMLAWAEEGSTPFCRERLKIPVFSCADGKDLRQVEDLASEVIASQFTRVVDWPTTCRAMKEFADIRAFFDLGPGAFTERITRDAVRGWACDAHSIADEKHQDALFAVTAKDVPRPLDYREFRPVLEQGKEGGVRLRNRYTIATGRDPFILAGMTPTTADVPIVAAAANAGVTAELAGGGQVTAAIFEERCRELAETLEPGAAVVFNALYLDRYLWDLHLGDAGVVYRARANGAPFCGVTVSAGIPPVEEAVALLERLEAHGLWLNAFKPGTIAQIDQVLAIADAAPDRVISVHVEGGQAGGHHSWEALDDLLLARYDALRGRENLLLCVGGGIGTEDKAASYLLGRWSRRYGLSDRPVDAVLIGTAAMATREALTSDAVKKALVEAPGTDGWVPRDRVRAGCTSGRSSLNADIHYLDSQAARCSRLLDEVLRDPASLESRRTEVIDALNRTARPYFGDLGDMPVQQVLERLFALTATGAHGRYEDGRWKDRTWRLRAFDLARRLEARYEQRRAAAAGPVVESLSDLDEPEDALARLRAQYPCWLEEPMTGADRGYFVDVLCARAGKPVPFVPVIDENVRRWFRADSLNDSHDTRFSADQVFAIPGPVAVAGISRADEPVAELFARFSSATESAILAHRLPPRPHRARRRADALLAGDVPTWEPGRDGVWSRRSPADESRARFFAAITLRWTGPLVAWIDTPTVYRGDRVAPNPLRSLIGPGSELRATTDGRGRLVELRWASTAHRGETVALKLVDDASIAWTIEAGTWQQQLETTVRYSDSSAGFHVVIDPSEYGCALRSLYAAALYDGQAAPVELFDEATHQSVLEPGWSDAITQLLSDRHPPIQANALFSWALPAIFRTLMADELAPGLAQLLHRSHRSEVGPAWPPADDAELEARARIVEVCQRKDGVDAYVESTVESTRGLVGRVESVFHLRDLTLPSGVRRRVRRRLVATTSLFSLADAEFLAEQDWVEVTSEQAPSPGQTLGVDCEIAFSDTSDGASASARGAFLFDGEVWARIDFDANGALVDHPVEALWSAVAEQTESQKAVTPRTVATATRRAPVSMDLFAQLSGDQNPIHRSAVIASLAGLDRPVVHGMWTAHTVATVVDEALGGRESWIEDCAGTFTAPLFPGEAVEIRAVRQAAVDGRVVVRATAHAVDEQSNGEDTRGSEARRLVYEATLRLRPPKTAWIFPGQGIQQASMGMDGYERSARARAIWDRADGCTRRDLGFSILRVVRENPRQLPVRGRTFVHPDGVLYLTQFTQVAMAVLASAQVAELREAGVFSDDGIACGHSVGEYNALAAATGVLSLETVVKLVYKRGLAMDRLVERDASGQSPYALGVVRPHYAGLSASDAEDLVQDVASETGQALEIVNYNIDGRQYSVTGHRAAIRRLEERLSERTPNGAKPAFVLVPGIDVPFHSSVLRDGVERFREDLDAEIPATIDPELLVGRYIPNLTARVFSLTRPFVEAILETTGSPVALDILDRWDEQRRVPGLLTRKLLVELLAWQFACPVRWIETQALLLGDVRHEPLVERVVEVGVGYQPTLANMASYSARLWRATDVTIANVERDRPRIFLEDEDPDETISPTADEANGATEEGGASVDHAGHASASDGRPPRPPTSDGAADRDETTSNATRPFGVRDGLDGLIAFQTNVRLEQLEDSDTIDGLTAGVSSRRNQLLVDLGEEFSVGAVDGAHELALSQLAETLERTARRYHGFGAYLRKATQIRIDRGFGPANVSVSDVAEYLDRAWALDVPSQPHVMLELALGLRDGNSARGGALGATTVPTDRSGVEAFIDECVARTSKRLGIAWAKPSASAESATVDSGALRALRDEIFGEDGVLAETAGALAARVGLRVGASEAPSVAAPVDAPAPAFREHEATWFDDAWATLKRDVFRAYYGLLDATWSHAEARSVLERARTFPDASSVAETTRYFATLATDDDAPNPGFLEVLDSLSDRPDAGVPATLRPCVTLSATGDVSYGEVPRTIDEAPTERVATIVDRLDDCCFERNGIAMDEAFRDHATRGFHGGLDFRERVAVVTGASPGSIGEAITKQLLRGGATVVVTSSSLNGDRRRHYRRLFQDCAVHGARLCCVPCDLSVAGASESLIEWLTEARYRTVNGQRKLEKEPLVPDLIVPFAAPPTHGTLVDTDASTLGFDVMVRSVHRLVAALTRYFERNGAAATPTQLLVPLSPNHGTFGGDGLYGESKLALEALTHRWKSEFDAWGRYFSIVNARIGWVRGTGLMEDNDLAAALLEDTEPIRTWSADEMGWMLGVAALCAATEGDAFEPATIDTTAGLASLDGLAERVRALRSELAATAAARQRRASLAAAWKSSGASLPGDDATVAHDRKTPATSEKGDPLAIMPLEPSIENDARVKASWPARPDEAAGLEGMYVVVGYGEIGPWGTSRTRHSVEVSDRLSDVAVFELAWMTGLIRWEASDGGQWVDSETGEAVAERLVAERYREAVNARSGIRLVERDRTASDGGAIDVLHEVYLERPLRFDVATRELARAFVAKAPGKSRAIENDGRWSVEMDRGATIRVPRELKTSRRIAGQLPSGFDFARWGIPAEMIERTDRLALMNLVATVDAFLSAGLSPEELLSRLHPVRVANTQGAGMGGMESLRRMYHDHLLGDDRQNDVLQESLINVVASYVVQSYVGGYGTMSHPVAACATAAVSVEEAIDKLRLDKADFVVAGAFDDIGIEGMIGFGDMSATAATDDAESAGMAPDETSRPNDRRRRGFVESQGGGTLLITRGSVARDLGLPVHAVVGWAGSFGDGIQRSVPAPGQGLVGAISEAAGYNLRDALRDYGLSADDIGVVYKHDTSTPANDPNENRLHHELQRRLARTTGNPLAVVSQKWLTGHPKGGAAAWQSIGLIQTFACGIIPGNRNLESVDPEMRDATHLLFSDTSVAVPRHRLRAGLVTSLGFGHVNALLLYIHPDAFVAALDDGEWIDWRSAVALRERDAREARAAMMRGEHPVVQVRTARRFAAPDNSSCQRREEIDTIVDATSRLGRAGYYERAEAAE